MQLKYKKIAVKIGSNVLTSADEKLNIERIQKLVTQFVWLHRKGIEIIIVSSGAVAAGRNLIGGNKKMDVVDERQLYSAIGQVKLINHYRNLFEEKNIIIGQILTTKTNFEGRNQYLNQRNCIQLMLDNKIIPIINENDAVSLSELMFTDNDELSGLIATMMNVDALFILSNVDGVYNLHPDNYKAKVIRELDNKKADEIVPFGKSKFGRGGMKTKIAIASKVAKEGVDVYIANGMKDDILIELMNKEKDTLCTLIKGSETSTSSIKRWIAHSDGFAKGEIYIDDHAQQALCSDKAVSLLPVGITKIKGIFEKDDIVQVLNTKNELIGYGKTLQSSEKVKKLIGKKQQRPIIHYDYLYLL